METTPRRISHNITVALALAGSLLSGVAAAEPMSTGALGATPSVEDAMAGRGQENLGSAGVRQSPTVELLLKLQDRPAAIARNPAPGANDDDKPREARPAAAAAPEGNAMTAQTQDELKSIALGTAGLPPSGGPETNAAPLGGTRPGRAEQFAEGTGDVVVLGPDRGLFNHPLLRFIRENRVLTITGCLGVLAAMWLTANFTFRRRR